MFLVWSFITKKEKRKKIFRVTALVLFIIFTNPFLYSICIRAWQPKPVDLAKGKQYSAAILLGGMTMNDKHDRLFFGPDADRFIQTTKLYHSGNVSHIVLSGGLGSLVKKGPLEADQLHQQLLMQGIPDSAIIIENRSRNTYENAVFTHKILDSLKLPQPYVLVTSAMHMPRAISSFNKAGVEVIAYPAAYKQIDTDRSWDDYIIPSPALLSAWNFLLKEFVGIMVYRWTGKA